MKVYFNNSCKICKAEIDLYKKEKIRDIDWIDITNNTLATKETSKNSKELLRRLHVKDGEKVLDGWDAQFSSQVPYYHWAKVFLNSYKWEGEDRTDIEGLKYGSEMILNPNLILEAAYDDKELKGLEDEWYAKLTFIYPGRDGPTALDGKSSSIWKEEKDMSGQMLTKVKRQNKIMIEFRGSSTVSRTD